MSGCGPPLYEPDLSAGGALTRPVQDLCELWRSGDAPDMQTVSGFDLSAWSTFQIVLFLDRMLDLSPLPHGTFSRFAAVFLSVRLLRSLVLTSARPSLPRRGDGGSVSLLLVSVRRPQCRSSDPLAADGGEEQFLP